MSDSVQQAYRFLVARFKKPEGNASSETAASHNSSTTTAASTSSPTNTSTTTTSTAPQREPAESFTDGSPPDEASTSAAVVVEGGGEEEEEEEELVVSAVAVPGSPSLHSPTARSVCTSEVNDPSDPSTSHVAEVQISDPSLSITDRVPAPVSEDHGSASPSGDHQQPLAGNDDNNNNGNSSTTTSTLSRSIAVTMNLTVNVRHHNHHHRHHLPPVHFIGAMDEQMQGAAAHGQHQHQHHHHHQHAPIGPIGVGFIEPVNPLLARARHRLYSLLLLRAAMAYFLAIPPIFRKCFEYSVLATAISAFALLIHLHVSLIRSPLTCLDHVADSWPRDGILRVQISMASSKDYSSSSSSFDALRCPGRYISEEAVLPFLNGTAAYPLPLTHGQWRAQMEQEEQARRQYLLGCPASSPFLSSMVKASDDGSASTERLKLRSQLNDSSLLKEADALRTLEFYPKKHGLWPQPYMVEYSLEYGLLRLSEEMRAHYNVPLKVVSLCPEEDACFGDPLARFILYHFLGYDDVLIGSIKRLAEKENNRGYVRNVATGEHFRFVNVWMTRASYIAAAFIMIVFTLFVSMLIRYSHQQVFVFVSEFLRTVEMQQPFSRITMLAASLITVVLALIGMEAIMFEFFNDSSIAFHVIIMVWAADQFDSMAARSAISKRHFLRFFYLYQFAFYAYHYRFNGQYAGLALMVTMLFTYHSMIFFFHHYELPLVQAMEEHIRFERRQRGGDGGGGTGGGGGNGADGANGSAGVEQPPREARSLDNGGPAEGGSESTTTSLGTPQTSTSAQTDADSAVSPSSAPPAPSSPSSPPPSSLHTTSPLPPAPPHHHHHPHHHFTIRHQLCSAQCQSPLAASRFPFGAMNAAASQRLQPQQEQLPTDTFPTPVLEVD